VGHFGHVRYARRVRDALRLGHKLIIHAVAVVGLKKFKKALIKVKKRPEKVKKQLEKVKFSLTVKKQDMRKVSSFNFQVSNKYQYIFKIKNQKIQANHFRLWDV